MPPKKSVLTLNMTGDGIEAMIEVDGKEKQVLDKDGSAIFQDSILFEDDNIYVGSEAEQRIENNQGKAQNYVQNVAGMLALPFSSKEMQQHVQEQECKIISDNDVAKVRIEGAGPNKSKDYAPVDLLTYIIKSIKQQAEMLLGGDITEVTVIVPDGILFDRRLEIEEAMKKSSLELKRLFTETEALSLPFMAEDKDAQAGKEEQNIIAINQGAENLIIQQINVQNAKAVMGEPIILNDLGKNKVNELIVEQFVNEVKEQGVNLATLAGPAAAKARAKLKNAGIKAQRILKKDPETTITIKELVKGRDVKLHLTRKELHNFSMTCDNVLKKRVEAMLAKVCPSGARTQKLVTGGNPRLEELLSKPVQPSFASARMVPRANFSIQQVAFGHQMAAVQQQCMVQCGYSDAPVLRVQSRTPASLGTMVADGTITFLIEKGAMIPTTCTKCFVTASDQQTAANVKIYQGEMLMAKNSTLLSNFLLEGIPAAPAGEQKIAVTYSIDESALLKVRAVSQGSGSAREIVISSRQHMVSDAELRRRAAATAATPQEDAEEYRRVKAQGRPGA